MKEQEAIVRFLTNSMLIEFDERTTESTDLFRSGLIDSYGYVELVVFLEKEFQITISEEDLLTDALMSVANMVRFVGQKQASQRQAA